MKTAVKAAPKDASLAARASQTVELLAKWKELRQHRQELEREYERDGPCADALAAAIVSEHELRNKLRKVAKRKQLPPLPETRSWGEEFNEWMFGVEVDAEPVRARSDAGDDEEEDEESDEESDDDEL